MERARIVGRGHASGAKQMKGRVVRLASASSFSADTSQAAHSRAACAAAPRARARRRTWAQSTARSACYSPRRVAFSLHFHQPFLPFSTNRRGTKGNEETRAFALALQSAPTQESGCRLPRSLPDWAEKRVRRVIWYRDANRLVVAGGAEQAAWKGGEGPAAAGAELEHGPQQEAQAAAGGGVGEEPRRRFGDLDLVLRWRL